MRESSIQRLSTLCFLAKETINTQAWLRQKILARMRLLSKCPLSTLSRPELLFILTSTTFSTKIRSCSENTSKMVKTWCCMPLSSTKSKRARRVSTTKWLKCGPRTRIYLWTGTKKVWKSYKIPLWWWRLRNSTVNLCKHGIDFTKYCPCTLIILNQRVFSYTGSNGCLYWRPTGAFRPTGQEYARWSRLQIR